MRAFPNRFPASGFHEVIVHSPVHDDRFELLHPSHRHDVLTAWSTRTAATRTQAAVVLFNRGRDAGATRAHEHSQVMGLDIIPPTLEREHDAFSQGDCTLCEMAWSSQTLVAHHDGARLITHPAPAVAGELLVVPECAPRFEAATDSDLTIVGSALADALFRVRRALGEDMATNVVLHTAPTGTAQFHWHLHIYPRSGAFGGLEVGAELPIVSADPEDSARRYRGE